MNDDRDNSNVQSSSEGSSTEIKASSDEKNTLTSEQSIEPDKEVDSSPEKKDTLASEQSIKPDKEDPINKDFSVKGWLLLLVLLVTLGTGLYFYTYKKDSSFLTTLPDSLMKLFSTAPQLKNPPDIQSKETLARSPEEVIKITEEVTPPDLQSKETSTKPSEEVVEKIEEATSPDTQSKEILAKFPGEIVEQAKRTNLFDKTTNENAKTIELLRNEIQSLKAELKQKPSPSQSFRIKKSHISGGFLEKKPEEATQQENKKPIPKIITSPANFSPAKDEPMNQQSHLQKKSQEKRSEEVQAYLDFVENTGEKLIELIEKGWTRLQILVMKYRKNN
ncbi:MAG: hypothetical protein HOD16_00865 [Nitrospina sp.]|nr:hypothetical protein [Nitrospina sp.]